MLTITPTLHRALAQALRADARCLRHRGMASRALALFVAAALAAALTGFPTTAASAEPTEAGLASVLGELQKGGLVIYFRHSLTEQVDATNEPEDLGRCETQRNLSVEGRAQATRIGAAIKTLHIPVGTVDASPFCRTKDTARLAFGRVTVNQGLYFVISTDAKETQQLADALRRLISTPPAKGTNTVLVSHSANLQEAAGVFAKPEGAAYVFRPLPEGRFQLLAKVLPEDWARVATLKRPVNLRSSRLAP
jgi:broad specificity phosphatase PhoE